MTAIITFLAILAVFAIVIIITAVMIAANSGDEE
jgi:hypothetical protein